MRGVYELRQSFVGIVVLNKLLYAFHCVGIFVDDHGVFAAVVIYHGSRGVNSVPIGLRYVVAVAGKRNGRVVIEHVIDSRNKRGKFSVVGYGFELLGKRADNRSAHHLYVLFFQRFYLAEHPVAVYHHDRVAEIEHSCDLKFVGVFDTRLAVK